MESEHEDKNRLFGDDYALLFSGVWIGGRFSESLFDRSWREVKHAKNA